MIVQPDAADLLEAKRFLGQEVLPYQLFNLHVIVFTDVLQYIIFSASRRI
jgi:hypothetical protein